MLSKRVITFSAVNDVGDRSLLRIGSLIITDAHFVTTKRRTKMISLSLTMIDDRWVGLCKIDGDFHKVILIPGSATSEWRALLQPTLFIELTEGNPLTVAIKRSYDEMLLQGQPVTQSRIDLIMNGIRKLVDQEALDEITNLLKEKRDPNGESTHP
jgi:hypothetical protein